MKNFELNRHRISLPVRLEPTKMKLYDGKTLAGNQSGEHGAGKKQSGTLADKKRLLTHPVCIKRCTDLNNH